MEKLLNMSLSEIYLDYVNNFITIQSMSVYYGVDVEFMDSLYTEARYLYRKVYR